MTMRVFLGSFAAFSLLACGGGVGSNPGNDGGSAADGGARADGGVIAADGGPSCETVASWDTRACQDYFLAEKGVTGFEPCGDASILTAAEVKAACPMASTMSVFTTPPPPPATQIPLRCDADVKVAARADFFCKGANAERRVVLYLRDHVQAPPSTGNELFEVFASQYWEHSNGGGSLTQSRVVQSFENGVGGVRSVSLVMALPNTTTRRVFTFSSRTIAPGVDGGPPSVSSPRVAYFGMATHTTPR